ncbi:hypothetical protein ACJX0J_022354 [Zea mays]
MESAALNFFGKRNLIPIFFDLDAADCLARDIVEKRGDLKKELSELELIFKGKEPVIWKETEKDIEIVKNGVRYFMVRVLLAYQGSLELMVLDELGTNEAFLFIWKSLEDYLLA